MMTKLRQWLSDWIEPKCDDRQIALEKAVDETAHEARKVERRIAEIKHAADPVAELLASMKKSTYVNGHARR